MTRLKKIVLLVTLVAALFVFGGLRSAEATSTISQVITNTAISAALGPIGGAGTVNAAGSAISAIGGAAASTAKWLFGSVGSAIVDLFAGAIAWVAYGINWLLATIIGVFIGIIIYVITVVLQLNGHVVTSPAVQFGFSVTLSVANLGFVLAIIIIAIATILRRQSYGIKQLLWKLVVAAILVNFSLVIGGVIINFANQLTSFFLSSFPGGGGGAAGWNNFATSLAGAFTPQRAFLTGLVNNTTTAASIGTGSSAGQQFGGALANYITPIFSVVFVVAMLIVILITLLALLILLVIRYIYLSFLLILMPLAWLFWIFPKLSGHFDRWWNQFIRWSFFAPIVMFFLWLAVQTSSMMSQAGARAANPMDPSAALAGLGYTPSVGTGIIGSASSQISGLIGSVLNGLVGTFLQMIVVVGLAVGGMFVADKMGIIGAKAVVNAVKGGGKAFGEYAVKRGGRAAVNAGYRAVAPKPQIHPVTGAPYNPIPTTRLQKWRAGLASSLYRASQSPTLATKTGLAASVWGGMKKGSGLFKGKQVNHWECQNQNNPRTGQPCGHIETSVKKPIGTCPNCGALPAVANWTQVS